MTAARRAMIAITTNSSIRVKPDLLVHAEGDLGFMGEGIPKE
jgi:hypothetical protein